MAGESPDKSEQRKSSGTTEERDPRLAVFREPVAAAGGGTRGGAAGAGADGETDGTADSRTAVFRVPRSADADPSEDGPAIGSGPDDSVETDASAADDVATDDVATDGAAKDASVSGGSPAGGDAEPEETPAAPKAPEGSGEAPAAPRKAGKAAEAEERGEEAAEPPTARTTDESATTDAPSGTPSGASEGTPSGRSDDEGGAKPEAASSESEAEAGSGSADPAPTDARLRAAVAAWVSGGEDDEAAGGDRPTGGDGGAEGAKKPDSGSEPVSEAGGTVKGADAEDAEASAAGDDKASADSGADDAEAAAETKVEAGAEESDSEPADAPAAGAASGSAPRVPKSREESSPAEKPEKAEKGEKAEKPEKAEEAEEAEEAEKTEKAGKATGADTAEKAAAAEKPAAADKAEAAGRTGTADKAKKSGTADSADDERGIDHPTAVFKAPRVDRVDQPTTALKLPSKKSRTGSEPAPGGSGARTPGASEPSRTPETPAERTSRFVPLRSDDVRPAPTVVGPTVTPDISAGAAAPAGARPALTEAERTRQQPMPPKPPLDLLAELTNTPPPEETPVRTAVRRVKIWTPLLLLALIIFAIAQAVRPLPDPVLTLSADPTFTFGGDKLDMPWPEEGQGAVEVEGVGTIGSYGKEESAPIASVAKIMTAYVILQGHPITGKQNGEQIVVDAKAGEEANRPDESTAPIQEGQKYTERQMLQLLMIPSGNNVARLLARWDATSEKAFVEKMNAAAKDLGMTNSVYTDPSGLEPTTRSTPADQLKLARAVTQNDVFREIVNMPQADIPGIGKTIYNNNNILLEPGVSGIKTGSSTPAGGNLVWTAETVVDGKTRRIIGAVMGANLDGTLDAKLQRAIHNSLELIRTAQKGVDSATVVKKGQVVGYVDNGFGVQTPVVATKDLKAVGWGGLEVKLDLSATGEPLQQAAKAGTVVGQVTIGTGTGKVTAPVALQDGMTEPGFGDKLTRIS
ncbi:D-alanyl-D-alanine carboxypeptidase [Streptomyces sp. NBC_00178]|uniref:serine hydrolase n=1 Tax=Streptomyces sp. NBC_00178 TaxID=2975672 RepID=UPI002E2E30E2|nr:serine hydrolase [Streptomyces sp. NBC_00178]